MKTLYILRHAKSSWDNPGLDDFDRPLNQRGEKDAPKMGKRMRKGGHKPDFICTSPALRAFTTAQLAAEEMHYPLKNIHKEKSLYHAGSDTILSVIRNFSDEHDSAMIVGHNPGLTDFVNELLDQDIANIPTAGFVVGKLKIDSWKEAVWGCGKLESFDYPKKES